jgi:glycosyltransferase involved in cell wall biosynthesis
MITVCIPAYQAGAFIGETVSSVLAQTFDDFRLEIAIDPPDRGEDSTEAALEPFRDDPRVNVFTNSRRLGWAGNFHALLQEVKTPFYAPLPHDDIWSPDYLATFTPLVSEHPEASVAYGDMTMFGTNGVAGFRSVALPQGEDRIWHLIRFMLQGAHAMPWRGVTRQSAIAVTQGFPTDFWGGFAVEVEYALGLLEAGPVIHVPKALYRKRVFTSQERVSASMARAADWAVEDRIKAWKRHYTAMQTRMLRMLSIFNATRDEDLLVDLAFRAAMLKRRHTLVTPGLDKAEAASLAAGRARVISITHPLAPSVAQQLEWFDIA